jgi:hypothetical protein
MRIHPQTTLGLEKAAGRSPDEPIPAKDNTASFDDPSIGV